MAKKNSNIVFSGSLLFVPLADLFQLLGSNNCTGILTLRSQYSPDKGIVYFMDGNPVNASYGILKGLEAVHGLFGWMDGKYEFSEEKLTGIDTVITQGRMGIVLDALRLLDDGLITRVGPEPLHEEDIDESGADGAKVDFVHPVKGSLVDYQYVTREEFYPDGATIVKEGNYGKWLWVIYQGTVRISKETPKGSLTLARLGEGCFIGTIKAFLYGENERIATAVAEGDVRLCILDVETLHREYASLSENFKKILLSLDNRLSLINSSAIQAYSGSSSKELPADKVFEQKFNDAEFYIIRKGTADIIGKGPRGDVKLLSLGADDVFGKPPFMDFGHEPLSASVMTSNPFEADILDSQALQKEYENLSHTFRNFVFSSATNISMTTKLFYHLIGNT